MHSKCNACGKCILIITVNVKSSIMSLEYFLIYTLNISISIGILIKLITKVKELFTCDDFRNME